MGDDPTRRNPRINSMVVSNTESTGIRGVFLCKGHGQGPQDMSLYDRGVPYSIFLCDMDATFHPCKDA